MYPPQSARLSFAPAHLDKRPAIKSWQHLQHRVPTEQEMASYPVTPEALLIACGEGSGNLEVLDFDEKYQRGILKEWLALLPSDAKPSLFNLPLVRTQSGGYHIYYRLLSTPDGNLKLAKNSSNETTIETRGQGGYVIAPPSHGYEVIKGDIYNVPTISQELRDLYHSAASELDRRPSPVLFKARTTPSLAPIGDRPGDTFDRTASWLDILTKHGWHSPRQSGSTIHLTRPGKKYGTSGMLKTYGDHEVFIVYSSNAAPFESEKYYTKLGAYTLLNHGGDFKQSVAAVAAEQKLNRIKAKTNYV